MFKKIRVLYRHVVQMCKERSLKTRLKSTEIKLEEGKASTYRTWVGSRTQKLEALERGDFCGREMLRAK